jgi:uncharacterized protein
MRRDLSGRGVINVLAADRLITRAAALRHLPAVAAVRTVRGAARGRRSRKPRLVFFFDEAHLLFDERAQGAARGKVEQVVRLIRSKGVGVYFVTQNPLDVPDDGAGPARQSRAARLRAFTPRDQKAVRAAATTFRSNPRLDVERVITELGVGEALVSLLQDKGIPGIVDRCLVRPPTSRIGPITPEERRRCDRAAR